LKCKGGALRLFLLVLAAVITLIILVPILFRISIDLTDHKSVVETAVSNALGRNVSVDGEVRVTTSLWPYFEINGLRVANPEGFREGDMASMELARVSVGLLPLLNKKIHIREFRVEGLALNLERDMAGAVNWEFADLAEAQSKQAAQGEHPAASSSTALAVDKLQFENISVNLRHDIDQEGMNFVIEQAEGSAAFGEPMTLYMNGVLLEQPFTLEMEASSLGEFLALAHSWLKFNIEIAQTQFRFSGMSDALGSSQTSELEVSIEGERLDSLDDLLGIDLPPLADYRLGAKLTNSNGRLELSNMEATVKSSTLNGNIVIDQTGAKPFATLKLAADTIQLDDFDTGDWSPDAPPIQEEAEEPVSRPPSDRARVLSPETLHRANAKLEIKINQVQSGEDKLGSGELNFELKDGRVDVHVLRLVLPKSTLLLKASVKPDRVASEASLRLLIENFDFGVLMRLKDPDSEVGGTLNVDLDITASASGVRNLMSGANGYFDVSGNPTNLKSGAIDLWAVNLLSSVVSSVDEKDVSSINCVISRWSLENGLMTAQNLAVDTTKIRICGKGVINFNDQTFNLTASPTAKRPEFFSLATPLAVNGTFQDFRIGTKMGVLTVGTTAVKFAVSPITTPVKRLIRDDLPADGADICGLLIGPREGELEEIPGC
jgi:uncharacterized protein involved in outer membrane biogenesis